MSRRKWFFGVMAFVLLLDVADTWLKGMPYLRAQAWWILRLYDVLG